MRFRLTGLWRHPDFLKLWAGQTISQFGSQITMLALPLTAALVLGATPAQMGLLGAVEFAPFLLFGLFAGAWVDRLPRRPILIAADIGRALVVAAIPAAALTGQLRMELLYATGFLGGLLTLFFDVAYQAFLPSLVGRDQLVEGNSKLEVSASAAQVAGPGMAGALVQVVGGPIAMTLDALSFLASALFLGVVRKPEFRAPAGTARSNIWIDIGEGLRLVFGDPLLRAIAACTGTFNLFAQMMNAIFILYATRRLGFTPGGIGLIYTVGNVGFLLGALLAGGMAERFRLGRTIVLSSWLGGIGALLAPLAGGDRLLAAAMVTAGQFLFSFSLPVYNINQVTLRQAITPHRLQGRMNATMRFLVWGTIPIGSVLGGALGTAAGLRPTLAIGAAGMLLAPLWVLLSPVWRLRAVPAPADEAV